VTAGKSAEKTAGKSTGGAKGGAKSSSEEKQAASASAFHDNEASTAKETATTTVPASAKKAGWMSSMFGRS
jgi:hypothetical protein